MVTPRNSQAYPSTQYDAMITKFSKSLTYTPVVKNTNNVTGDETFTEGTSTTIKGVFYRKDDIWNIKRFGEMQGADAIMLIKTSQTVTRNSKITFDSKDYRIKNDPVKRYIGADEQYIMVRLFRV